MRDKLSEGVVHMLDKRMGANLVRERIGSKLGEKIDKELGAGQ
jgi:hypothetical protein